MTEGHDIVERRSIERTCPQDFWGTGWRFRHLQEGYDWLRRKPLIGNASWKSLSIIEYKKRCGMNKTGGSSAGLPTPKKQLPGPGPQLYWQHRVSWPLEDVDRKGMNIPWLTQRWWKITRDVFTGSLFRPSWSPEVTRKVRTQLASLDGICYEWGMLVFGPRNTW